MTTNLLSRSPKSSRANPSAASSPNERKEPSGVSQTHVGAYEESRHQQGIEHDIKKTPSLCYTLCQRGFPGRSPSRIFSGEPTNAKQKPDAEVPKSIPTTASGHCGGAILLILKCLKRGTSREDFIQICNIFDRMRPAPEEEILAMADDARWKSSLRSDSSRRSRNSGSLPPTASQFETPIASTLDTLSFGWTTPFCFNNCPCGKLMHPPMSCVRACGPPKRRKERNPGWRDARAWVS